MVSLGSRTTVEIRDIDCYTEKCEVEEALQRDIPGVEYSSITLFPSFREQKIAVVVMHERSARKLLNIGKLKIGWTYCRVRERAVVTRCFKCFGYGHVARNCEGPDRRKLCYRCMGADHKAKLCTAKECCVLCLERGIDQTELDHIPGSGKYKVYREALQTAKNRL